jgi:hypothetical protein
MVLIALVSMRTQSAETERVIRVPSKEWLVSADDLDWHIDEGWLTGRGRIGYKRHCPVLSVLDQDRVLVSHVDLKRRLVIWEVTGSRASKLLESDHLGEEGARIELWPDIVVRDRRVLFLTVKERVIEDLDYSVVFSELDLRENRIEKRSEALLAKRPLFRKSRFYWLEGLVPIDPVRDSYMAVGASNENYVTKYLILLNPEGEQYDKHCTMLLTNGVNGALHRVEDRGRFDAQRCAFAVGTNGIVHCAWVRSARKEKLCYSQSVAGSPWSKPQVVYPARGWSPYWLVDVSIACFGSTVSILWVMDEAGFYFTRFVTGDLQRIEKIGDWNGYDSTPTLGIGLLNDAPSSDLAVDKAGNTYALWVLNRRLDWKTPDGKPDHKILLRVNMAGEWQPTMIISEGYGVVRSSSLVVDESGQIHIVYLRQTKARQFGCFYRRLRIDIPSKK